MKEIMAETDTTYGTLNVKVSGYDMTVVEHYSQYIHNLCNRLGIKVAERWGYLESIMFTLGVFFFAKKTLTGAQL